MGLCRKCGSEIRTGMASCPSCGMGTAKQGRAGEQFDSADIAQNKAMAAISYIGILVAIPLFSARESGYARWHAGQGLALLLASAVYSIAYNVFAALLLSVSWELFYVIRIVRLTWLAFPVLAAVGIANALNGRAKELPVIGKIRLLKDI